LGKDGIPAIWDPEYVSAEESEVPDETDMIGLVINGEARAYSLNLLDRHEIVNDTVGGRKVAVTWCPLCNTSIVYDRMLEGNEFNFGVSGKLWKNALVMYDRETDTLWSHLSGIGLEGQHKGKELQIVASYPKISWGEWRSLYPQTLVLISRGLTYTADSNYEDYYIDKEKTGLFPRTIEDTRLPTKSLVVGLRLKDSSHAFALDALQEIGVHQTEINGVNIVVAANRETRFFGAYEVPAGVEIDRIDDRQLIGSDGERFSLFADGTDSAGLKLLPAIRSFWFAWLDHHPDTSVWSG
jgi:hypothetical protein